MRTKKIFTKIFIESFKGVGNAFDRNYVKFISTSDRFESYRNRIEEIINLYPDEKVKEIIKQFHSSKNRECRSVIAELFAFEKLVNIFNKNTIEVEVPLEEVNGLTPDFFISDKKIVFEVFSVYDDQNYMKSEIIELINRIDTNLKVNIKNISGRLIDDKFKTRDINQFFKKLFKEKSEIKVSEGFEYRSKVGICISGEIYPGLEKTDVVFCIEEIGTKESLNSKEVVLRKKIRSRILEKVDKYGKLKDNNIPFVIIIYDYISSSFKTKAEWKEIFDGMNSRFETELSIDRHRRKIFKTNRNRGLTGILVSDETGTNEFYYFKNPFSKVKLKNEIERRIKEGFNVSKKE